MLKDITFGQYYNIDSLIHKLDPRTKIRIGIIFTFLCFVEYNIILYLLNIILLFFYIKVSKVPIKFILRGAKSILIMALSISILTMLTTAGIDKIHLWLFEISYKGIEKSVYVFLRFFMFYIGGSMLMYTTYPTVIIMGLEKMFFLSKKILMTVIIALRFIPILVEELNIITNSRKLRDNDISKNLRHKISWFSWIITTLLDKGITRAQNIAVAMDARCYDSEDKKTKHSNLKYSRKDLIAHLIILIYFVLGILIILGLR